MFTQTLTESKCLETVGLGVDSVSNVALGGSSKDYGSRTRAGVEPQ